MALLIPHYIQEANIQDTTIRYEWDDWNEEQAEEPIDQEFLSRLKGISQRAVIAFTCGTAEWIVHRLEKFSVEQLPPQYIETAWAMIVDLRYCHVVWDEYTQESDGWVGPIRRPIALAMIRVEYTFEAILEYGNPELSAAWITNLAQYLLPDPKQYLKWRESVMNRLESLYPMNPKEKLGEVVPREALDPDFDFKVELTEKLINEFLSGLDYRKNTFLNSPEEMLGQGFEGKPYVFDIQADRKSRHERA